MARDVEMLTVSCRAEVSGAGLERLQARLDEALPAGERSRWSPWDDGGPIAQRVLRAPGFCLFAAALDPENHLVWRFETGLSAGDSGPRAALASALLRAEGGALVGVLRSGAGDDVGLILGTTPPPGRLDPVVDHAPTPAPLFSQAALGRPAAETLLARLLREGPADHLHALAAHPVWEGQLPGVLRRAPWMPAAERGTWHRRMCQADAPVYERLDALERLLAWSCEVDLDTHNFAPWLPLDTPADLLEPFLEPALEVSADELVSGFADDLPEDQGACWSFPPRNAGAFQRLMAVWRHPSRPPALEAPLRAAFGRLHLGLSVREALAAS